jgi:hypothetical protein
MATAATARKHNRKTKRTEALGAGVATTGRGEGEASWEASEARALMEAVADRGPAAGPVSTGASTGASARGSVSSSSRASLFRERANAASLREVESSSRPEARSRGGTHGRKKEREAPPVSWGAQVPQVLSFDTPSHLLKKQPKRPVGMSQGAYDALVHARSLFEAAMV